MELKARGGGASADDSGSDPDAGEATALLEAAERGGGQFAEKAALKAAEQRRPLVTPLGAVARTPAADAWQAAVSAPPIVWNAPACRLAVQRCRPGSHCSAHAAEHVASSPLLSGTIASAQPAVPSRVCASA